jgi:secreted PhoX family phosphatase
VLSEEKIMSNAQSRLSRRTVFAGAGTVGALAAAAAVLPVRTPPAAPADAQAAKPAPAKGGYQLTAHVQRYYDTTRG